MTNQLDMIEESYFKIWFSVFTELFEFVVSIVLLSFISPWLTLFVLLTTAIQMIVPKVMSPLIAKKKLEQAEAAEEFTVTATEHLNGFDLLRSFQLGAKSLQAITAANSRWESAKYRSRLLTSVARLLSFAFGQIIYVGIYFFGALLTILGQMTIGTMIAASQLVVYVASPLQSLNDDITEIRSAKEIISKLRSVLNYAQEAKAPTVDIPTKHEGIQIEHVTFAYEDAAILRDVCVSIERGEKYLLCGPSGAGKSTLIQLITGALRPDEGRICVDGIDINNFDSGQYARFVLQCSQNTFLFNASLKDNVTLFNDHFTDEEVIKVLKNVGLEYIFERFEDGLDEIIAQGGHELSGGERQKIALARMELYDPPVVIFDESFANIDLDAAKKLIEYVVSKPRRTVILIAHQLSDELAAIFDNKIIIEDAHVFLED